MTSKIKEALAYNEGQPTRSETWIDCEKALGEITRPDEDKPFEIEMVNSWLSVNRKLFEIARTEWMKHSCFGSLPCSCSDASAEYRLYRTYDLLSEISELNNKELFFKKQLKTLETIEGNDIELNKWLTKNEEIAIYGFDCLGLDFWDECDRYEHVSFPATLIGKSITYLYLQRKDFIYGVQFLERYRKIYVTC